MMEGGEEAELKMNTGVGRRYTRRYAEGERISSQDLMTAYKAAAGLVADHGEAYLPLFERLDTEVQTMEKRNEMHRRAIEVAMAGGDPPGPPGS